MKVVKTKDSLSAELAVTRQNGRSIVLVPTMGALHAGHLDLVRKGKAVGDVVVCSIFVNPTQFNDPKDLEKYPRSLDEDLQKLESVCCDVAFIPETEEMYSAHELGLDSASATLADAPTPWNLDLGVLDEILEGRHRPEHFQGVSQIVYKLFNAVRPDLAIFGQKDLQQFKVVERMVALKGLKVELVMAPIVREPDGLAMSSRNVRLTPLGRQQALAFYRTLEEINRRYARVRSGESSLAELRNFANQTLTNSEGISLEYFAICDRDTLLEADESTPPDNLVALVAGWVDGVRLIDNMLLTGDSN